LLELIVVVAILGILVTLAQAAWWGHVVHVRRSDATVALMTLAAAQEAHFMRSHAYTDRLSAAPPAGLGFPGTTHGWYSVSAETSGADGFRIVAVPGPGSPQAADSDCSRLWIDETGQQGSSPAPPSRCWR
jgi:type IV pilus assembly protein PilE